MSSTTAPRLNESPLHHDSSAAAEALRELEHDRRLELDELKRHRVHFYTAGRVLLSALFIVSGLVKAAHFDATVASMTSSGISDAALLLPFAIALELFGGAMLLLGWKARAAAWTLIGYVASVTLLVHWDVANEANRAQVLSNVAFIGALLMLAGHGAGAGSLDRAAARKRSTKLRNAVIAFAGRHARGSEGP